MNKLQINKLWTREPFKFQIFPQVPRRDAFFKENFEKEIGISEKKWFSISQQKKQKNEHGAIKVKKGRFKHQEKVVY